MSKVVEGKEYLTMPEVLQVLNISKPRFYANVKPHLRVYQFEGKKAPWYSKQEVLAVKAGRAVRKASIVISGILGDWTSYLASLGFRAQTVTRAVTITTLPQETIEIFHLAPELAEASFVRRSRMTYADSHPICTWDTYYPLDLVSDIVDAMLKDEARDIVEHIKTRHGLIITYAKDKYMARQTTLDEQNLFHLLGDEPVLQLQRVSFARDHRTLILYSDMALLGSWFAPEHEYEVNVWSQE